MIKINRNQIWKFEDISNNIMKERIHDEIKLLEFEKLKTEHAKLEHEFAKTRAETKGDNLGDFEKKEGI